MNRFSVLFVAGVSLAVGVMVSPAWGQSKELGQAVAEPTARVHTDVLIAPELVPVVDAPPVDLAAVAAEDAEREAAGLPPRFAIPNGVSITPQTDGAWELVDGESAVWRLRVLSPGALSLNLGFTRYDLPTGGRLMIYATDYSQVVRPFTAEDNYDHGQLWTPVVLSDDITVELTLPMNALEGYELELSSINVGYRGFGETEGLRAGACNVDVICPEADPWRDEIPAIGVISTGGSTFCTGFMVNNTALDQAPYFMTANHCGVTSNNAASLVAYWNFQSPTCGQHGGGSLSQFTTGSTFKASWSTSDFTLVRFNSSPNPAWGITFAGWERGTGNPTSAVGIHHPSTDEKSICFDYNPLSTTTYLGDASPGDGTHLRVDWDLGVTEPGSSGSPMFDQNHHVVGQLHGGYSACDSADMRDWYGRFSKSWAGGGTNSTRLSNWLDAGSTGAMSVDTLVPGATGLKVTPLTGLSSSGNMGGPFTPNSVVYTLENLGTSSINYSVTKTQNWVSLSSTSGTLAAGATTPVTVSINSNANSLGNGIYTDTVNFINTTDHTGDTSRGVTLQVGIPQVIYSFPMDTNPGWTVQSLWAFGHPTGSSAGADHHGGPDPANGHTGTNVYGYNLNGDYENNLTEKHLTTTAINCSAVSGVTVKFWRWLGVERNTYDHAYVRVSNNGSTWTTVWENGTELAETSWSQQSYDISAVADHQATVYIRWTMGSTDSSWTYCGWNIDDVEIWGLQEAPPPAHLLSAKSWKTHGSGGSAEEFYVNLPIAAPYPAPGLPGLETRGGGLTKLTFDFDRAITLPANPLEVARLYGAVNPGPYGPAGATLANGGSTLVTTWSGIPNADRYVVCLSVAGLTGDSDVEVIGQVGNVQLTPPSTQTYTDGYDNSAIGPFLGQAATQANCKYDLVQTPAPSAKVIDGYDKSALAGTYSGPVSGTPVTCP